MLPFLLPRDRNGIPVSKFLDAFEPVRFNMGGEPKYYGYLHPDSHFVITRHTTTDGDEHLQFYKGQASETLADVWANRATLTYVEYDEAY